MPYFILDSHFLLHFCYCIGNSFFAWRLKGVMYRTSCAGINKFLETMLAFE